MSPNASTKSFETLSEARRHAHVLVQERRIPTRNDGWGNLLFRSPNVEEVACPQGAHEFFMRRGGAYFDKLSLKVKTPFC